MVGVVGSSPIAPTSFRWTGLQGIVSMMPLSASSCRCRRFGRDCRRHYRAEALFRPVLPAQRPLQILGFETSRLALAGKPGFGRRFLRTPFLDYRSSRGGPVYHAHSGSRRKLRFLSYPMRFERLMRALNRARMISGSTVFAEHERASVMTPLTWTFTKRSG